MMNNGAMINMILSGKKILVTGGSGMIGRELIDLLLNKKCDIYVASIDRNVELPSGITFKYADLRDFQNCIKVMEGMDVVFNLVGIKASPKILAEKPASSFVPHLQFNTNTMEAAMKNNVEWYMYTSTVGVYETEGVEILTEDDVWLTFPSKNDWFGGWAKRMGELQAQAYEIEYKRKNISVVRPGNVYGRYDNFDPENAMVIPSLISKAVNSKDGYFSVWGDGKTQRDFIHARDVARGMLYCVEKEITEPINLGSGEAYTIKSIAEIIAELTNTKIKWDTTKPSGDSKRLLDMTRAKLYGFESEMTLRDGIEDVLNWYMENKEFTKSRYNTFEEIK